MSELSEPPGKYLGNIFIHILSCGFVLSSIKVFHRWNLKETVL